MSNWTYIKGVITVNPLGRTQPECRYIVDTVLAHLPVIRGSEEDMYVQAIPSQRYDNYRGSDEFGKYTNNLINEYGVRSFKTGRMRIQSNYIIVVEGYLRDRYFDAVYKEFVKWLCRLAKRLCVEDVLVNIRDYYKQATVTDITGIYEALYEYPLNTVGNENDEPSWTDYLRWEYSKKSEMPMLLEYKYHTNSDVDKEVKRRLKCRDNWWGAEEQ